MATTTTDAPLTETLTIDMISDLRSEASQAGDDDMEATCDDAANPRIDPQLRNICKWECAGEINRARKMDDSVPYVRVVVAGRRPAAAPHFGRAPFVRG
ncbi:MAG TPA: hypothetical protein VMX11_01705 [Actinomycetes bacterium]|nr:hypothetical protein [Actinomycetes bacterium]